MLISERLVKGMIRNVILESVGGFEKLLLEGSILDLNLNNWQQKYNKVICKGDAQNDVAIIVNLISYLKNELQQSMKKLEVMKDDEKAADEENSAQYYKMSKVLSFSNSLNKKYISMLDGYIDEHEKFSKGNSNAYEFIYDLSKEGEIISNVGGIGYKLHAILCNFIRFAPLFLKQDYNKVTELLDKIREYRKNKKSYSMIYKSLNNYQGWGNLKKAYADDDQLNQKIDQSELNQQAVNDKESHRTIIRKIGDKNYKIHQALNHNIQIAYDGLSPEVRDKLNKLSQDARDEMLVEIIEIDQDMSEDNSYKRESNNAQALTPKSIQKIMIDSIKHANLSVKSRNIYADN